MDAVVAMTDDGGVSVIGGGETATAAAKWGYEGKFTHVSTGGSSWRVRQIDNTGILPGRISSLVTCIQNDHSGCSQPPVDIKTKVLFKY